jgi:hypothetical protein
VSYAPPLLACLFAALVSLVELTARQKKSIPLRATHWVILRLAIEGGTAAFAYAVLLAVFAGLPWIAGAWGVLVAGLAGPALLRSQLALLGSGQESSYYGPATSYQRLQKWINEAIDDISSVNQSAQVLAGMDRIGQIPFDTVANCFELYVRALERLSVEQRENELLFLESVRKDTVTDQQKIAVLIFHLIDLGGRRQVRQLAKLR